MNKPSPFDDPPPEKRPSTPIAGREMIRIARQLAADANAGRSSYTMGMLIIVSISCAAILGVCATSLQKMLTNEGVGRDSVEFIIAGVLVGIPFGIIVALFVRISTPTIFLGGMMGGLVGAISTPAALNAKDSPTMALAAAAIVGPALILAVSYVFAHLSRRTSNPHHAPAASSPWDAVATTSSTAPPTAEIAHSNDADEESDAVQEGAGVS